MTAPPHTHMQSQLCWCVFCVCLGLCFLPHRVEMCAFFHLIDWQPPAELPIMEISTPGASYPEEQDQVPPVEEQHAAISTKKVAIESEETQPQKGTPLPPSPPKRAKKKGVQMQDPVEKKKVERPLRKREYRVLYPPPLPLMCCWRNCRRTHIRT